MYHSKDFLKSWYTCSTFRSTPSTTVSHGSLTFLSFTFTDGRPLALKDIWEGVHECYQTRLLQGPWDTITQQVREYFHFIVCNCFPLFIFSSSSLTHSFPYFTLPYPNRFQFKDSFLKNTSSDADLVYTP